jgi:nucleotide-binding universal stress UspA family protein
MTAMRIIVATDGSPDAMAAIEWTRLLPLPADSRFLVVSAVPPPVLPSLPDWETETRHALVRAAQAVVDDAVRRLGKTGEARLVEGDPREAIITTAMDWDADLVVMGARGLSAVKEIFLGSVSLGVARHAPCPVLVCKGTPRSVRTLTVAHDGSPGAGAALRFVAALPLSPAMRLRVVGIAQAIHYPATAPDLVEPTLRAVIAQAEDERRRSLKGTLAPELARLPGRVPVELVVSVGIPARAIVEDADAAETDLLVVGARGLGAMKRLALGSVSESVLRHAGCPVLVVRGRR